jgi:serine/threonine protein kinase/tetratricopeptide (TPR) repeat protein
MTQMTNNNQDKSIEEAVRQFVDAQSQGREPDIDEFVKQYPQLERKLRKRIRNLEKINALFDSIVHADESDFADITKGDNLIGRKLGQFEVMKMIGRGGMGVVYLAHDTKLGRSVAIKSIPHKLAGDSISKSRLHREAKLLASLNHPNIAVIHDIIEQEEGAGYLILEYVPGETLSQRIARKKLKLQEALYIAQQVAEAVSTAHDKGIVHRDLKPGNIKIKSDGRVKVLDFGLAKAAGSEAEDYDSTITGPGSLIGTPSYMSPEQIRGKPTDHRTDVWSFGCLLYEMLTAERPFEGDTVSDTVAHVLEREPDWKALPLETPANIKSLLIQCLKKDRELRLQHIGEAVVEISQTLNPPPIAAPVSATSPEISRRRRAERWRRIAVLPFANMSIDPDNEYFSDGLAEDLINALAQIEGLRVVARTSAFQFKGQALDIRDLGKRLDVETILEGSVRKAGNQLRITAQLIDTADGYHIWSERYARELQDVFAIQEDIAEKIVGALKVKLVGERERLRVKHYTENVEAYNLYLRGRFHWNKRTPDAFSMAISYFERSLAIEPDYAMVHTGLADCYVMMGTYGLLPGCEAMPKAKDAALKALNIDDTLPGAHCALGLVSAIYEYDWQAAEQHYQRAIELDPDFAISHAWYAWFLLVPTARFIEAEVEAKHALELDPVNPAIDVTLGFVYHMQQQDDKAVEAYQRVLELDPDHPSGNIWAAEAYLAQRRYGEAITAYERAGTLNAALAGRALAYGMSGKRKVSQKLLDDLKNTIQQGAPGAAWIARSFAQLGEIDLAFEYLEKAYRDRDTQVVWLKVDPFCDPLRSDRRFNKLLSRMNLLQ